MIISCPILDSNFKYDFSRKKGEYLFQLGEKLHCFKKGMLPYTGHRLALKISIIRNLNTDISRQCGTLHITVKSLNV